MMWWNDAGWGAGQWIAMTAGMVLFWTLLALAVYLLIRTARGDKRPAPPPATPDQILAEGFARGEIDGKEYEARRATLHGGTFAK